ncbi:MAG TPA: hypothetical protein VGS23_05670 [Thermoplasmata archaeon]|nr:hypothetical protein [Thermoplasmata archaeon]
MAPQGSETPVLRRLLEAAGYRLEERRSGLLAVRVPDRRVVFLVDGLRSPTEVEDEVPADMVHRTLVYSEDPGAIAREIASNRGLEILDATSLGPALGELLLPPPGPSPDPAALSPDQPLEPPAQMLPEGELSIRPRLDRSDAEAIAGVDGLRYSLRMVPFFVAPYRVRVATAQGVPGPPSDHLVAVNALSGRVEVWEGQERELSTEPLEAAAKLPPVLTEEMAASAAEETLRRRHTVSVDHSEQHGGTIIVERRRVAPGLGDLRIGAPVLVHVPFWYGEGADGRIVLNAVTGARRLAGEGETAPEA